ncbi:MAG: PEP-CTERM sorting domain-containing protein [Alphaproteobacteria bacterium]
MRLTSVFALAALVAFSLLALVDPVLAGDRVGRIPEPGTLGLLAAGAVGIAYLVRKRRK